MRRPLASLLLASAVFAASPVWAASGLDAARASAAQARARVNQIRGRQLALRGELNQLAQKIETLKAQQKGALITGSELDASLRRSQELSGSLSEAAQQLAQAQAEWEQTNLALLTALNQELEDSRAQWDRTRDRAVRAELLKRMRALRDEREQIRAMLPPSKVPALQTAGSDDPEDLLEQADALRDSEDKVRQKMRALEARISELREEKELERRMNDFLGDEAMFDDADRRLRRTKELDVTRQGQPPLFGGTGDSSMQNSGPAFGTPGSNLDPSAGGGSNPGESSRPTAPVNITQIVKSVDSRPQMGGADALLLDDSNSRDLGELEAELKKLSSLAKQLDERAKEMELKARELQ